MRKLLSILLTAVFLLQLAPFPAHGEAGPAEHEETETDTLREYAALLEDEEEVVGSFLCAYVMNSWDDLGPTVYISLYDQNDDYVDDPGGEFQYLWYYNSRGVSWGSCEDITPVGLTAAAWSALGGTDAVDSCVNCTKSAAPFFLRDEVRSAVDPLWTSDPHRPAFTTDDIDTSQYTEGGSDGEEEIPRSILMEEMDPEGGAEAFCAYVGVIVRWRESSESEWSFYAATDPDYGTERVDLQPGADYVPVFSAAPPYAGYPADCFTGQDAMTYISVEVSYPFGEIAYQWYKTDGESYDGAALEGETEDYMRVPYPNEPGADHYYCEVTYSFRDLEPGLWRSPIIPVIRTEAEGFWAELRPFSIYRGEITSSYPQRGSGSTMSNTPFQVVNQNEYNSYGLYDAYFHTAVGDTATISVYLRPASSRKTFTHCDRFTYEWYWSDRESERGDLIGSGSVEGLDAFSNDPISVGKADYSLLNQAANIHVNPPTDRAGLFYLTFTGTVHYGEYTYEESTTQTVLVLEDPMELFDFDPDTGDLSRYTGCSDELVIPAEIHGVPVKSFTLGMRTTAYTPAYTGVRKVTLPEGLEKIGYNCFYKLASLEECNIPSTVTEIGANAFSGTELSAVQFGADCFPLMGNGAFSKMQYLTRVVLPQNAQGRLSGTGTFADCPNLLQVQNYGQILDPDPSDDFKGTPALSRMLNGAEDDGTLYYEKNEAGTGYIVTGFLRETARVTIPDTFRELPVVAVENSAIENCSVITEVTVGTGVTEIRDRAFRGCANLRSLTLSEGL